MEDRKQIKSTTKRIIDEFVKYIWVARGIDDLREEDDHKDLCRSIEDILTQAAIPEVVASMSAAAPAPDALNFNKKLVTQDGKTVEVLRDGVGNPALVKFSENDSRFVVMINGCVFYLNSKNRVYMGQGFVSVINKPEFDELPVKIVLYKGRGNCNVVALGCCPGMTGYESTKVDNIGTFQVTLKVPK